MTIEAELAEEIRKWSEKLDKALSNTVPLDKHGESLLENIRAYREDLKHFFERDPIKSFECLIWAWALLEVGRELGHLKVKHNRQNPSYRRQSRIRSWLN